MTESPNQRHPGVAHGTGLDVGMNVDGDEQQVGMPVREMDWQSQGWRGKHEGGIVIVTVTVMEDWPRGGGNR